jgi:hypothetical protein
MLKDKWRLALIPHEIGAAARDKIGRWPYSGDRFFPYG